MNTHPISTNFAGRLLNRTGGFYVVFVIILAQLLTTPVGIALAALLIGINSELTIVQITELAFVAALLMLTRNVFLLIYTHAANREAISRLRKWVRNELIESG